MPLTLVLLATDCSPSSWAETTPHREINARSATRVQHNIQWDKEECACEKDASGNVRCFLARQSRGAEIEGASKTEFPANFSLYWRCPNNSAQKLSEFTHDLKPPRPSLGEKRTIDEP